MGREGAARVGQKWQLAWHSKEAKAAKDEDKKQKMHQRWWRVIACTRTALMTLKTFVGVSARNKKGALKREGY